MLKDKIKDLISINKEDNNKKKIENLVVFVIILIITMMTINYIWNDDKKNTDKLEDDTSSKQLATYNSTVETSSISEIDELEAKLKEILKSIRGVGNVNVFINFSETSTVQAMYNENIKESATEETDTSGGNRKVEEVDSQKEIIYIEENGKKKPITQKIVAPKLEGAIITAEGASDLQIKSSIIQAVEAVTGLATHKIQVFEMRK